MYVAIVVSYVPWISAADDRSTRFSRFRTRYSCKLCFSDYTADHRNQWSVCSSSQVTLSQEKEPCCRGAFLALMLYFHVHNLKLSFLCMGCSSFKNMSKFIISLRKRIARHMLFFLFSCCVQCQDLINTCYITCCSKARHCEYDISCSYVG
jgi:hypothetical protein